MIAAMAKASRKVLLWLGLGLGAIAAWQLGDHFFGQRTAPEKLINQLWLERMPAGPRDMVWHILALEQNGRRVGALGRASRWRVASDGFIWSRHGDQFRFHTPQNGCRSQVKARTWKCAGKAPRPFDLCLELEGGSKKYLYYSREDWEIKPGRALPADADFAAPALQAALAVSTDAAAEADEADGEEDDDGQRACAALGSASP
jgi:hypothetical protein